jgi:hypothetical protein
MTNRGERTRPDKIARAVVDHSSPGGRAADPGPRTDRVEPAVAAPLARRDPRRITPLEISRLQRTIGNHAVGVLLRSGGRVAPSPTRRALPIQRTADPAVAPDVVEVIRSGTANYGVYILRDGNETVAVKFSMEDTRRAAFADKVLEAAGVGNTRAVSKRDGAAIIRNIEGIARRYEAGTDAERATAARITANIGRAGRAASILIMDRAEGRDFHDVMADPNADKSFLDTARFHEQLGRLAAADALLGNSDRFSAVKNEVNLEFAILNPANFKVTAQGIINTLDNDTQLAGLPTLRRFRAQTTPEEWVSFLVRGGKGHVPTQKSGVEVRGERITPNMEALFDPAKRRLFYDELKTTAQNNYKVRLTVDFDTFDASFSAGLGEALTGILLRMDALRDAAVRAAGADRGGGLIDPEALESKGEYLKERLAGASAGDAESRVVFRAKARAILAFPSEFVRVPTVYTEADPLTKFGRALTPNSKIDTFAEQLKEQARTGGVDAATLKQGEDQLDEMIRAKAGQEPDRRVFKALFEAKCARLQLYLQEADDGLQALLRGEEGPSAKGAWLRKIQFRATLEANYRNGVSTWIYKLNRLDEPKRIAAINKSVASLVDTADAMEKAL